VKIKGAIATS